MVEISAKLKDERVQVFVPLYTHIQFISLAIVEAG